MKIYILSRKKCMIFLFSLFIFIIFSFFYLYNNTDTFVMSNVEEPIRSGHEDSTKMAFTCNVDWGTEEIGKMLEIFEKEQMHITFFVSGRWAHNNPQMLKLIHEKGHEIGSHAYSHKMHSKISKEENYREIKKTEDVIMNILGKKPIYFAPPSGDYNETTLKVAKELGYQTILWSVDTIDWKEGSTKDVIINRVMKKPHKGAILLMHPKPATVEALPSLIEQIKNEGIKIGTISELLNEK
ncbi:polysaccharide deacetylase family protein [Inediibacterium massiliense]|uniref:polysaccharide deacetylase family protein n=1 Tax=Inediibacterium massiliense TaxID=1658111 RepID=UPI0006B60A48|nr:polysaccharide deacetylase family protein [Inediibacterium massiliense]